MKYLFCLFLLCLTCFAHSQTPEASPTAKLTVPLPPPDPGNDYDFNFSPIPRYLLYARFRGVDTVTQALVWKKDSIPQNIAVMVEKKGDRLRIAGLYNPSESVYNEAVLFKSSANGVTTYEAKTEQHETVLVCPSQGWIVLVFRQMAQVGLRPGDYNYAMHYFGKIGPSEIHP